MHTHTHTRAQLIVVFFFIRAKTNRMRPMRRYTFGDSFATTTKCRGVTVRRSRENTHSSWQKYQQDIEYELSILNQRVRNKRATVRLFLNNLNRFKFL